MGDPAPTSYPLSYQPAEPRHSWRRTMALALAFPLLLLIPFAMKECLRIVSIVQMMYHEHQWATLSPPSGAAIEVVQPDLSQGPNSTTPFSVLNRFKPAGRHFFPLSEENGTLLLSKLVSPNGTEWWCCVELRCGISKQYGISSPRTLNHPISLTAATARADSLLHPAEQMWASVDPGFNLRGVPVNGTVSFFWGAVDSNRRSHFTIRYMSGLTRGLIDGTISDSGAITFVDTSHPRIAHSAHQPISSGRSTTNVSEPVNSQ